jgi:hypothetical protein
MRFRCWSLLSCLRAAKLRPGQQQEHQRESHS